MSVQAPAWHSLDETHADAVRAAHRARRLTQERDDLGTGFEHYMILESADVLADLAGTEHAGLFVRAAMSTLRALDVEARDLLTVRIGVGRERRVRLDSNAQPSDYAASAPLAG